MSFKMSYFKIIISKALFINNKAGSNSSVKESQGGRLKPDFPNLRQNFFQTEKSVDQGTFQPVKEKSVARRSHIVTGTLKPEEKDKKGEKCLEQN